MEIEIRHIALDQIRVSAFNTRRDLAAGTEDADINDLANSIRERGLLSPVTVRAASDGQYDLVAGQRRFLACQQLKMATIPAIIRDDLDDTGATIVSLIENVQRADMNPMDKARAYQGIFTEYGDIQRVAKETGVTPRTVRRYLPLLSLGTAIQDEITTSGGVASIETLSNLAETFAPEVQGEVLDQIRGLSSPIQLWIIKESGGNVDLIPDLKMRALEAFNTPVCREGLCPIMPEKMKTRIKIELGLVDALS